MRCQPGAYLRRGVPLRRIECEQFFHQILRLVCDIIPPRAGEVVPIISNVRRSELMQQHSRAECAAPGVQNLIEERWHVLFIERREAAEQNVEDHAKGPAAR